MDYSQHLVRINPQIALDRKSHIGNWEGPVASWIRSPIWVPRNDLRTGCPGSQPREMDVAELLDVEESRTQGAADDEKDGKLWNRAGISLCEMGRCLFSVFLTVIFCILISHVLSMVKSVVKSKFSRLKGRPAALGYSYLRVRWPYCFIVLTILSKWQLSGYFIKVHRELLRLSYFTHPPLARIGCSIPRLLNDAFLPPRNFARIDEDARQRKRDREGEPYFMVGWLGFLMASISFARFHGDRALTLRSLLFGQRRGQDAKKM